jgi:outer membrane protein OmpA-like peptidoglycan-associated protein
MSQADHRSKRLLLQGFADSSGGEKANLDLSKARAEAVAKELRSLGLSPVANGWGSALPIAPNDTAEGVSATGVSGFGFTESSVRAIRQPIVRSTPRRRLNWWSPPDAQGRSGRTSR